MLLVTRQAMGRRVGMVVGAPEVHILLTLSRLTSNSLTHPTTRITTHIIIILSTHNLPSNIYHTTIHINRLLYPYHYNNNSRERGRA